VGIQFKGEHKYASRETPDKSTSVGANLTLGHRSSEPPQLPDCGTTPLLLPEYSVARLALTLVVGRMGIHKSQK